MVRQSMGNDWLSADQRRLLDQLLDEEGVGRVDARIAARAAGRSELPLSYAQQRMWFFHRLQPASTMYNIVGAATLRGSVDRSVLQRCVDELVRRHEVLRSTFHLGDDGEPFQRVDPAGSVPMPVEDLRGLTTGEREEAVRERYQQEINKPFDLGRDLLLRPVLLQVADEEHFLLLSQHHIATDGWSLGLLLQELSALYGAYSAGRESALAEPEIQYGDFAVWQQEQQPSDALATHLDYWRERLTGAHALELPTGRLRPPERTWDGDALNVRIAPELAGGLKALGESERATPFMVLLAGVSAVLSRWSGQRDLVMGVPVANRNRAETEAVVGSFVNTLPMRIDLTGEPTFREFLRRVRQEAVDGYAHQDVPFEKIIEEINPEREASAHTPLIRHMLGLHNTPWDELSVPGLSVDIATLNTGKARFDLEFELAEEDDGGIGGLLWFASDVMDKAMVERLLTAVYTLLEGALDGPDTPVWRLPLYREDPPIEAEIAAPREPETVPALLAAAPGRDAQAPAVSDGEQQLTLAELAAQTEALAARLRTEHQVAPGDVVGICMPPSAQLPVALLAVLTTGAVALPLEQPLVHPVISEAMQRSWPSVVLTTAQMIDDGLVDRLREAEVELCAVDRGGAEAAPDPGTAETAVPTPDDTAVIIPSRSGTLNVLTHAALASRVRQLADAAPLEGDRTVALYGGFTADLLVSALLWPLAVGGCVHLESSRHPAAGADWPEAVLTAPARIPALLAGAETGAPRWVLSAGEQLWPDTVEAFTQALPEAGLVNLFTLSEAGPVAAYRVDPSAPEQFPSGRVPVGAPLGDVQLTVLDEHGQAVPPGVAGDLYVTGSALARGRLHETPWPQGEPQPAGDRARWVEPGVLELLGRPSGQTTVDGRPLELGDVTAELTAHPVVSRAHFTVDDAGELIAHAVPEKDPPPPQEQWRDRFAQAYLGRDPETDPALNSSGWRSPRSGEELTAEAMREWTDAAVRHVLDTSPRRVLEIGCRNGQLLFRLAPRCDEYRATELSARARKHIGSQRDRLAGKADVVEVLDRAPDDFSGLADDSFDTVVLNSLVAHCPDPGYLERVLEQAVRVVRPGGAVFVGDVPDLAAQEAIHLPAEARRLPPDAPLTQLRQAVARKAAQTDGFALGPAFFHAVARRLPEVADVAVLRRITSYPSELTQFRYDAVLHVAHGDRDTEDAVGSADSSGASGAQLDWDTEGLTPATLAERLRAAEAPELLVVRGVPCTGISAAAGALRALHDGSVRTSGELLGLLDGYAPDEPPVDPAELVANAGAAGYEAVAGPSGDRLDQLTVAFRRNRSGDGQAVPLSQTLAAACTSGDRGADGEHTGDLTFAAWSRSMPALLRAYLRDRLPLHAVPATVEPLTSWPVRSDGGLDVTAFPPPDAPAQQEERSDEPRTPTQKTVQKIWADILGVDHIGIHDDFFALGGHSLMGAAVIDRLRDEFTLDLPLGQLFQTPTVAEVAEFIDQQDEDGEPSEETPAIRPIDRSAYRRRRLAAAGSAVAADRPDDAGVTR